MSVLDESITVWACFVAIRAVRGFGLSSCIVRLKELAGGSGDATAGDAGQSTEGEDGENARNDSLGDAQPEP